MLAARVPLGLKWTRSLTPRQDRVEQLRAGFEVDCGRMCDSDKALGFFDSLVRDQEVVTLGSLFGRSFLFSLYSRESEKPAILQKGAAGQHRKMTTPVIIQIPHVNSSLFPQFSLCFRL
jgi:hypothetical protein